jgi:hypothetical protein
MAKYPVDVYGRGVLSHDRFLCGSLCLRDVKLLCKLYNLL